MIDIIPENLNELTVLIMDCVDKVMSAAIIYPDTVTDVIAENMSIIKTLLEYDWFVESFSKSLSDAIAHVLKYNS